MFALNQDIEVRFDVPTGPVWRRGTIIDVQINSDDEVTYVVAVRWHHHGQIIDVHLVFTVEDIANGMFRRI